MVDTNGAEGYRHDKRRAKTKNHDRICCVESQDVYIQKAKQKISMLVLQKHKEVCNQQNPYF